MNYCLDILENATETQKNFDLRTFEKYMLLEDTYIEPYARDVKDPDDKPGCEEPVVSDKPGCEEPVVSDKRPTTEGVVFDKPGCEEPVIFKKKSVASSRFTPRQQNSLFWCFFAAHYGMKEYEMIGTRYQNAELEEKYRISEALEKVPGSLKATNYSLSKQSIKEVCAAIASSTRDDFFSLIAFCAYYKTRTLVVFEESRTYLEFLSGESDPKQMMLYATRYKNKGQWTFSLALKEDDMLRIENEYVALNTYLKPLKGIGSYKSDDLVAMAEKMGIEMEKKDGKKDLYEKIGQRIGTINSA